MHHVERREGEPRPTGVSGADRTTKSRHTCHSRARHLSTKSIPEQPDVRRDERETTKQERANNGSPPVGSYSMGNVHGHAGRFRREPEDRTVRSGTGHRCAEWSPCTSHEHVPFAGLGKPDLRPSESRNPPSEGSVQPSKTQSARGRNISTQSLRSKGENDERHHE
jgi:hypothetical protein